MKSRFRIGARGSGSSAFATCSKPGSATYGMRSIRAAGTPRAATYRSPLAPFTITRSARRTSQSRSRCRSRPRPCSVRSEGAAEHELRAAPPEAVEGMSSEQDADCEDSTSAGISGARRPCRGGRARRPRCEKPAGWRHGRRTLIVRWTCTSSPFGASLGSVPPASRRRRPAQRRGGRALRTAAGGTAGRSS